jgi:hypothetical protein
MSKVVYRPAKQLMEIIKQQPYTGATLMSRNRQYTKPDIEQLIEQAKTIRSKTLREKYPAVLRTMCWGTVISALIIMLIISERPARQRALEATTKMETVAKTLAAAAKVAPDTAQVVTELLRRPEYDCNNLACDASLASRNRLARARLQLLLTRAGYPNKGNAIKRSMVGLGQTQPH